MNEIQICNHWIKHFKKRITLSYNTGSLLMRDDYKSQLKYWQTRKLKTVLDYM